MPPDSKPYARRNFSAPSRTLLRHRSRAFFPGTHPRKVSRRRCSACGPGAARPLIQKRRMDRAHSALVLAASVLAVHVDVRPPPGVSIDTPLLLGSGGRGRKLEYLRGSRSVLRDSTSNVRTAARRDISESFFLSGLAIEQDPTGGSTLRSSVVHSPGRASSNPMSPLAWLASLNLKATPGRQATSTASSRVRRLI